MSTLGPTPQLRRDYQVVVEGLRKLIIKGDPIAIAEKIAPALSSGPSGIARVGLALYKIADELATVGVAHYIPQAMIKLDREILAKLETFEKADTAFRNLPAQIEDPAQHFFATAAIRDLIIDRGTLGQAFAAEALVRTQRILAPRGTVDRLKTFVNQHFSGVMWPQSHMGGLPSQEEQPFLENSSHAIQLEESLTRAPFIG